MNPRFHPLFNKVTDSPASSGGKGAGDPAAASSVAAGVQPAAALKCGVFVTLHFPTAKPSRGFRDPIYGFRDESGNPLPEQPTGFTP